MAESYSLSVDAGATYNAVSFLYKDEDGTPINLTGWTGKLQIRETPASSLVVEVIPTLTSAGMVEFELSATQTALLTQKAYVYAIELTDPDGVVVRLIGGKVNVSLEVVR